MTPTWCDQCEWVTSESRKRPPFQWLCARHRRLDGHGFLSPEYRTDEPFLKCRDVNGGLCETFEPKREKPNGQED